MRKTVLSVVLCASMAATAAYAGHETLESEPVAAATFEDVTADRVDVYHNSLESFVLAPQEIEAVEPQVIDNPPKVTPPAPRVDLARPPEQEPRKELVYILGDSIMQGAQTDVEKLLIEDGWQDVVIHASCGRPLIGSGTYQSCDAGRPASLTGLAQIEEDRELIAKADQVVVALGTNDYASSPELFGDYVEQTINLIRSINQNAPVHWVNTYLETSGSYQAINTAIAESEVDVIDFAAHAPAYYGHPECPDGTHPCENGYRHLAQLILTYLED